MGADLEIDLLRAFVAISETRNFTLAAKQLHRVQSAVSMKIKRLEDIVGCRLFERNQKFVRLTPEGEILLRHTQRILELNDQALADVGRTPISGTVRLGTSETYAACLIPDVLERFAKSHPEVVLDIHCGHGWNLVSQMDSGEFDLVLAARLPDRADGHLIRQERLVWVCREDSDVCFETPLPLAVFPGNCYYRSSAIRVLEAQKKSWHVAYTSPSHAGLMASVLAGRAVTVVIESALEDGMRVLDSSDGFSILPMVDICLYEYNGATSPAARTFAHQIRTDLAQHFYKRPA